MSQPDRLTLPEPELPDGDRLLALEADVRRSGSGLTGDQLAGLWCLEQIWPRGERRPQALSGVLLRGLGAALRLETAGSAERLIVENRVQLGAVELRFSGEGELGGRRPLLHFGFDAVQLRLGKRVLLERRLPPPDPRRRPFFALIGRGTTAAGRPWLAARGRGGGLALWCRGD